MATITDLVLTKAEELGIVWDEETGEETKAQQLAAFWAYVSEHPEAFPVTGHFASKLKTIVRRHKGHTATPSRKNKRKARQESRMRTAKARRSERREHAAAYNEARERIEAEQLEAQEAHEELLKSLEGQSKFDIIGPNGEPILQGVPESFIRRVEGDGLPMSEAGKAAIVLPAGVEAA